MAPQRSPSQQENNSSGQRPPRKSRAHPRPPRPSPTPRPRPQQHVIITNTHSGEVHSTRGGGGFLVAGHHSSQGSSAFSHPEKHNFAEQSALPSTSATPQAGTNDSGDDSDGTEIAGGSSNDCSREQGPTLQPAPLGARAKPPTAKQRADEVGMQDTFIAGIIYALSRRLLPGATHVPGIAVVTEPQRTEGGRSKLDKCLKCTCSSPQLHSGPI